MAAPSIVFPGPLPSTPVPKATVVQPPALSQDGTLQAMGELRCDGGAAQTTSAQAADTAAVLSLTRDAAHHLGSALTLKEMLQQLHKHVNGQRNEALRRLSFFHCRQAEGEILNEFYVRLKQASGNIDL